jgi:uncharacterized membrane protein YfcA
MGVKDLSVTAALVAIAAMAVGSALQAALGIGMALFVVPILAPIDPSFIPGPMLLAGSLLTAMTAHAERAAIDTRGIGASLVGLAAGTVIGAIALRLASGHDVNRVFGVLLLVAVLISVFGKPVAMSARNLLLAASASGVMGTMIGVHGPAMSLVFQNADPKTARAMLGAFFTVAYLGAVVALAVVGLFGKAEMVRSVILLPGVVAGLALAPLTRQLVDRRRLRAAILVVAAVSGVLLVVK